MAAQDGVRARLEAQRVRLEQELAAMASAELAPGQREGHSYATHLADGAAETFDQERALALARHVRGALGQVDRALQKLAAGTYGRCDYCGGQIDEARLEALPQAVLCFACQARLEGRR